MYGGLAPNPFSPKPFTECIGVPRAGELKRTMVVPPGMTLQIDTYISEGPVDMNIWCSHDDTSEPMVVESRQGLMPVVDGEPERFLSVISDLNPLKEHTITVVWNNSNMWGQKMIVYSLTVIPQAISTRKLDAPSPQHDVPGYKVTVQGRILEPGSPGLLGFFGF
jgi:hypothetical protein